MTEKELCFITVIGEDRKGIVARISDEMYQTGINIEDIEMKIMEGYFVMSMFVDVSDSPVSMEKLRENMDKIEKEMNLKIQVQHENVFKALHRV